MRPTLRAGPGWPSPRSSWAIRPGGGRLEELRWVPVDAPAEEPRLAFDHARLIEGAALVTAAEIERLELPFDFLPERFTLGELQALCENSGQTSVIVSPSSNFATNRRRSSITEHSFHGIDTSRSKAESVTHVSGTFCYLCLGSLTRRPPAYSRKLE